MSDEKAKTNVLPNLLDTVERQAWLDGLAKGVRRVVRAVPLGGARDVLHGRWLGHALHPVLVQVPIGTWTAAAILDLMPGESRAARRLVAAGLLAAPPAAAAGWVDWADQPPRLARTGLVHAAANLAAVAVYTGSLTARYTGRPMLGRMLGFGGLTVASAGGVLGGHLAYRQAAGVNHAAAVPLVVETDWYDVGPLEDIPVGKPVRRMAGETPVLAVRHEDGRCYALADRCSHMDGSLHSGEIVDDCIECPLHGSRFRLADGENVRGPATAPQPRFECRTAPDGHLEIRLVSN
ncbi:Rieske 2Fe-2S domain-containing protein [Streptomyces sp. 142MFCol3.1]|uniref:Rieske 2Fe-2S domain-containing protein n=1 Tax=Streptomyces sp. 142MFCol3.1 TaxID=1172179 RepID=UPI001F1A81B4|nr:Rieske (2Fe-2S) protein [Streptomyces sp. 142MFCol3.1]